ESPIAKERGDVAVGRGESRRTAAPSSWRREPRGSGSVGAATLPGVESRPTSRRSLLALAGACTGRAWARGAEAEGAPLPAIPLRFRIARAGAGAGVVADAFVAAQLADSNRLFAPHGISFVELASERAAVGEEHARLEDAKARDALAALVRRGVIDVF